MKNYISKKKQPVDTTKVATKKTVVIYFDGVFTRARTASVASLQSESTECYMQANLRTPERWKCYLDMLYFKDHRIVIINYLGNTASDDPECFGIKLIKRYLDIAFGEQRLYLHDDAIYLSSKENEIQDCATNIYKNLNLEDFWGNAIFIALPVEINRVKSIYPQCQTFTVTDDDTYFNRLNTGLELSFKHTFYTLNYAAIAETNQIQGQYIYHRDLLEKYEGSSLKTKIVLEVYSALVELLTNFLKIFEHLREKEYFDKKYNEMLIKVKIRFTDEVSALCKAEKNNDVTKQQQAFVQINTLFADFAESCLEDVSNRHIQGLIKTLKLKIAENMQKPELFQSQGQQHKDKMNQAIAEKMRQSASIRDQLNTHLHKEDDSLKIHATEESKACIDNNLVKFKLLQDDKVGYVFGVSQAEFINAIDYAIGLAPLHIACRFGYIDFAKYLFDCGANLELNTELSFNDYEIKVYTQFPKTSAKERHILYYRDNSSWYCCISLIGSAKPEIFKVNEETSAAKKLVEIAQGNVRGDVYDLKVAHKLVLYKSLQETAVAKLLKTEEGCLPIHEAIQGDHFDILELLLKKGAKPNAKGFYNRSPFYTAVRYGCSLELLALLIKHGADINSADDHGVTPLHQAVVMGNADLVRFLLSCGNINYTTKNQNGDTALMLAIKENQLAIVLQFIDKGIYLTPQQHTQLLKEISLNKITGQNIIAGLKLMFERPVLHMLSVSKVAPCLTLRNNSEEILYLKREGDESDLETVDFTYGWGFGSEVSFFPKAAGEPQGKDFIDVNLGVDNTSDYEVQFTDYKKKASNAP